MQVRTFNYPMSIHSDVLDLERWEWDEESQETWQEANPAIHEFYKRWRGSASTDLGHDVYIGRLPEIDRIPEQWTR